MKERRSRCDPFLYVADGLSDACVFRAFRSDPAFSVRNRRGRWTPRGGGQRVDADTSRHMPQGIDKDGAANASYA
ncbi:TPA: hypothetical protein ACGRQA_000305 [Stenotrophomonas maltophilia]